VKHIRKITVIHLKIIWMDLLPLITHDKYRVWQHYFRLSSTVQNQPDLK